MSIEYKPYFYNEKSILFADQILRTANSQGIEFVLSFAEWIGNIQAIFNTSDNWFYIVTDNSAFYISQKSNCKSGYFGTIEYFTKYLKKIIMAQSYLSKREDNTYSIIVNGCMINQYTDKQNCIELAKRMRIQLSEKIWSAEKGDWIKED